MPKPGHPECVAQGCGVWFLTTVPCSPSWSGLVAGEGLKRTGQVNYLTTWLQQGESFVLGNEVGPRNIRQPAEEAIGC
jgi:hypothetical protein